MWLSLHFPIDLQGTGKPTSWPKAHLLFASLPSHVSRPDHRKHSADIGSYRYGPDHFTLSWDKPIISVKWADTWVFLVGVYLVRTLLPPVYNEEWFFPQSLWMDLTQTRDKLQGIQESINPSQRTLMVTGNSAQWNSVMEVSSLTPPPTCWRFQVSWMPPMLESIAWFSFPMLLSNLFSNTSSHKSTEFEMAILLLVEKYESDSPMYRADSFCSKCLRHYVTAWNKEHMNL